MLILLFIHNILRYMKNVRNLSFSATRKGQTRSRVCPFLVAELVNLVSARQPNAGKTRCDRTFSANLQTRASVQNLSFSAKKTAILMQKGLRFFSFCAILFLNEFIIRRERYDLHSINKESIAFVL